MVRLSRRSLVKREKRACGVSELERFLIRSRARAPLGRPHGGAASQCFRDFSHCQTTGSRDSRESAAVRAPRCADPRTRRRATGGGGVQNSPAPLALRTILTVYTPLFRVRDRSTRVVVPARVPGVDTATQDTRSFVRGNEPMTPRARRRAVSPGAPARARVSNLCLEPGRASRVGPEGGRPEVRPAK